MSNLNSQAQAAMENLLNYDEEQLYAELAVRKNLVENDPANAGSFNLQATHDETSMMGARDVLVELGQRLFRRWSVEAHNVVCGSGAADDEDRKKIAEAFGVDQMMAGAAVAAFLVSSFGMAPAIAAVVAALAMRRFFRPGYEEFCKVWKKHLPAIEE